MRLTLRSKLILIIGAAAAALAVVLAIGVQLALHHDRSLNKLERRWLPKLELEPRLQASFERLGAACKDAVAAQDPAALAATSEIRQGMFSLIAQASGALDPAEAEVLRRSITDYHEMALEVSSRLLDGEAGEDLVATMSRMQEQHERVVRLIDRVARLDRGILETGFRDVRESSQRASLYGLGIGLLCLALAGALSFRFARDALFALEQITQGFARFAKGNFSQLIAIESDDELGRVAREANEMAVELQRLIRRRDVADWVKAGQLGLAEELRDDLSVHQAAELVCRFLAERLDAEWAALHVGGPDGSLRLQASHPQLPGEAEPAPAAREAEAVLAQVAREGTLSVLSPTPEAFAARSPAGPPPAAVVLLPLGRGSATLGVLELALSGACSEQALEFLGLIRESLAAVFESAAARERQRQLLDELRTANEQLAAQRTALEQRNAELEQVRIDLQNKATELGKVSSYKSQFLANMSHELRTPLNSMLVLSQLLADNEAGNLTPKQIEHCRTINSAGRGLLMLINQVLDLSKIEAGRQVLEPARVSVADLVQELRGIFEPQFARKQLSFVVEIASDTPPIIVVDGQSLRRILINLLGNALKFTEQGSVTLRVGRPRPPLRLERPELRAESSVAFAVADTGIGVPEGALQRIFARFEQADSRTARRFGGTGLGLAIAAESAMLMGGELSVQSVQGEGSTFTCTLPEVSRGAAPRTPLRQEPPREGSETTCADDRDNLGPDEGYLLIVEDDMIFSDHLLSIVHDLGFKALLAHSGEEGLMLARQRRPIGIVLDVTLPDGDGFSVRERLQRDPRTAGVPIHFLTALTPPRGTSALGAVGYLTKPATRDALVRMIEALMGPEPSQPLVLVVEDDPGDARSLAGLLRKSSFRTRQARTAERAVAALKLEQFDCMVLDLGLPDLDGLRLLENLRERSDIALPPVIVHTGRALGADEVRRIRAYAQSVVPKGNLSGEHVLAEVRHFVIGQLRDKLPRAPAPALVDPAPELSFAGAKILVADDDMRTVYALSALLRGKGAEILVAETGRHAVKMLEEHEDVRVVLMDVLMPEMDGCQALQALRRIPRLAALPVILLSSKATSAECERCLGAGANGYLGKPVDPAALLAAVQGWLARGAASEPAGQVEQVP